ncbi:MAG: isocitrate lyase/phosphoenolpyruvate mutase family protein [Pseudomonadota bacterium]
MHVPGAPFVMPNPWDVGSARLLAGLGFKALATTSAGLAFSAGRRDGAISTEESIAHGGELARVTGLPVNGDLENGFGDAPEDAARTMTAAAAAGLAGASLEDFSGRADAPIYDLTLATERIAAAAEARDALDGDIVLTARAEGLLHGRPDLDDIIRRLSAFEAAGADVLYAPALPTLEAMRTVCDSVSRPVNVVMGMAGRTWPAAALAETGVARISIGSALARAVYGLTLRAGREMLEQGSFDFTADAAGFADLAPFFSADD